MSKPSRSRARRSSRGPAKNRNSSRTSDRVASEEAIRAGEQIAMAAFASGLKLAAAFGTVAAKTAGLALASLASGADKFSELIREEAKRSYRPKFDRRPGFTSAVNGTMRTVKRKRKAN